MADAGGDRVTLTLEEDGVAQVRLARPDKLNALDGSMFDALARVGEQLAVTSGLRAVVLAGEGRAFCAGLDMASFGDRSGALAARLEDCAFGHANIFQHAAMLWRELPVPVIAAIHGACLGGGLQIASGADIRIAAPDARLSIMELKWGIVPDMGGNVLWRGLVREDALRELIYSAREFSGEEAQALGLVTLVDPDPLTRATQMAREIAGKNPHAIRAAKQLRNGAADQAKDAVLAAERQAQRALLYSPNQLEAVMCQMQARAPNFQDI